MRQTSRLFLLSFLLLSIFLLISARPQNTDVALVEKEKGLMGRFIGALVGKTAGHGIANSLMGAAIVMAVAPLVGALMLLLIPMGLGKGAGDVGGLALGFLSLITVGALILSPLLVPVAIFLFPFAILIKLVSYAYDIIKAIITSPKYLISFVRKLVRKSKACGQTPDTATSCKPDKEYIKKNMKTIYTEATTEFIAENPKLKAVDGFEAKLIKSADAIGDKADQDMMDKLGGEADKQVFKEPKPDAEKK
jgi:hypothetical protein